jgi:hypothetical protein
MPFFHSILVAAIAELSHASQNSTVYTCVILGCHIRMKSPSVLWARWKRLAHRAAEIQSHLVLAVLYVLLVIPVGLVRRRAAREFVSGAESVGWRPRPAVPESLEDARRQF